MDFDDDSSGTDDDFPPPRQNRMSRGGRFSGKGRPAAMTSLPYPRMYEENDMEAKIHQLEREAYISVLRAFKAQADAISWDKEDIITGLRKELRLSNEEHIELLKRANEDETIRRIREWRKSAGLQTGVHSATQAGHDPVPSPSVSASRKKQKMASPVPAQSFAGPSPSFHPQTMVAANPPSLSAAKRGPMMGPKGKKHKSIPPDKSSIPPNSAGRAQYGNRLASGAQTNEPAHVASIDPFVGRKVRTRWPEDNNFYEAVITDYNPDEGRHALVYDIGTANATWEWVNLSEISPDDIQWDGEDPGISVRGGRGGGPNHGINGPPIRDNVAGPKKGRGIIKAQSRKDIPPLRNGLAKKGPGDIQLLSTETVIKEVERVFGASHPDPAEIEEAKRVLKEHEQALIDAIAKLGDLCDGESDEGGRFLHGQAMDRQ